MAVAEKPAEALAPPLIDIREVARILDVSTRQIHVLIDEKKIPKPLRVGTLLRWTRKILDTWIADGCPAQQPSEGISQ